MKNQKGFVLPILIILALIILGVIAYFFSPKSISSLNVKIPVASPIASSDPTSNWKNYTDKFFDFSFNYPENFLLTKSSRGVRLQTELNDNINFNVYNDLSKTISEYLVSMDKISETAWEGKSSLQVQSTKKTMINGLSVVQRSEYLPAADITQISTYFKNREIVVSVTLHAIPGNAISEDQEIYNQILSTFKFIE